MEGAGSKTIIAEPRIGKLDIREQTDGQDFSTTTRGQSWGYRTDKGGNLKVELSRIGGHVRKRKLK